jgi:putative transposase
MVIAFISEHKDHRVGDGLRWGVEPLCTVLSEHGIPISVSTYYEWVGRAPTRRQLRDQQVTDLILAERDGCKLVAALGSRKMWLHLRGKGHDVARCTVERLYREHGWEGARYGKRPRTTIPDEAAVRPADLVERDFAPPAPNRLWVADFTYVPTWAGMVYVAFVVDAFARRVIGWRVASSMKTELVLDALEHAIFTRNSEGISDLTGLVSHSDAGSQGGFNRSSQHLDHGGAVWDDREGRCRRRRPERVGSGLRIGRCGRRCVHRAGPSRRVRCSESSGG